MITSDEIKKKLWEGANDLRGSMDASKYKDYMLGLMFYKFLSDKTLETFKLSLGTGEVPQVKLLEEYKNAHDVHGVNLEEMIQNVLGYFVLPEHLYHTWLQDIQSGDFELEKVIDSLNNFERTIAVTGDSADFKGLFSSSIIDLNNSALGSDLKKRSNNIKDLIMLFSDLNMADLQEGDILGDAYEYLIGQFASNAGKKAGEFYTPRQVSEVMAQIIAKATNFNEVNPSIYDPTVGSGSLLLTVRKHLKKETQKDLKYYGQEYITETYNLTRMNLLLHGIRPEKMNIRNGNTLAFDWPEDPERPNEGVQFDAVVMNPPYSDKKWNKREDKPLKVSDPRFSDFGVLPPGNKGDFAYLMHGLYHLGQEGTMAIVLPHGVLFRGGSEGEIRKRLIDKNQIDAIIGLPSNLFTNTGIPVSIIILKKNRSLNDPVLVIDASKDFVKGANQNLLKEKDTAKIVDTYFEKKEIEGYSHLASRDEIIANDYNMNIPRYVESISDDIPQDVDAHLEGGIPIQNIKELSVLQDMVPDIINDNFKELRNGYLELTDTVNNLTKNVLEDVRVADKKNILKEKIEIYENKWWDILKGVNPKTDLAATKELMLEEIKELLSRFEDVDIYSGYQIVADIWKDSLIHDTELIAKSDFYEVSKTREPYMVSKGQGDKKRLEQEGWKGTIVPIELIEEKLYTHERNVVEQKKTLLLEIESEIAELVESAKIEESEENNILYETLKKNEDGEPLDSFEVKLVKAEMKNYSIGSEELRLLNKVDGLLSEKVKLNKEIKEEEKSLKESVYQRIGVLTNQEIDELVFEKWFSSLTKSVVSLVEAPLKKELSTLESLHKRYGDTLTKIDEEIANAERSFEALLSELVIIK